MATGRAHLDVDVVAAQQLDAAKGRGGHKARGAAAREHAAHVEGVKPVDVFAWRQALHDRVLVEVWREGQLHEDAVDGGVCARRVDRRVQLALARVRLETRDGGAHAHLRGEGGFARAQAGLCLFWSTMVLAAPAHLLAGLLLARHVQVRVSAVAHDNDIEARWPAERCRDFCDGGAQLL